MSSCVQAGQYDFKYGVQYAWILIIFNMVMTFSLTTPLIVPFGMYTMFVAVCVYVPYSGKLSREKTFTNRWRTRNSRRKLLWIAWHHQLGVGVAVNFRGENFRG